MEKLFDLIHESTDWLIVNKPAGLVCHPTKEGERSSLIGRMRLHLGDGVKPHLVNRLDRETSGVVMAAKNSVAAGILGRLWQERSVHKQYLAVVHGWLAEESFVIDAALGRDEASAVAIKDRVRADGAAAQTEVSVQKRFERRGEPFTLLRLTPKTGRKHQLRIHLAHAGHPIVGDKLYGLDENLYLAFVKGELTEAQRASLILANQALHAELLEFDAEGRRWKFMARPSVEFSNFCEGG